eukprot:2972043-Karenia_brevis.AAC.1
MEIYGGTRMSNSWRRHHSNLRGGKYVPPDFNNSLTAFIPKDITHPTHGGLACAVDDLRPISMKDDCNKICSAVACHMVEPILDRFANHQQRGFIKNHHFVKNIIEIDVASRMHSASSS